MRVLAVWGTGFGIVGLWKQFYVFTLDLVFCLFWRQTWAAFVRLNANLGCCDTLLFECLGAELFF